MNRRPTWVVLGKFTWLAVLTTPKFALFGSVFGPPYTRVVNTSTGQQARFTVRSCADLW